MIKLEKVTYTYTPGGPFEKTALFDVSLNIGKGEFLGLIGHTGSGKSTLIQLFNGLIKPTSGKVFVDGEELFKKGVNMRAIRFKTGLVMQYPEYQLFEETVRKDIGFGPLNMGLEQKEIDVRVNDAAEIVGLSREALERSPFELSGGQKRRAAIAGILAMRPSILILDEPTAGLDPEGREEILTQIKKLHRELDITVILVSHSMEDVAKLVSRIVVMNKGRIAMDGTPETVFGFADELENMGLSVPQITKIVHGLKVKGMDLPEGIYTVKHAEKEILNVLSRKK